MVDAALTRRVDVSLRLERCPSVSGSRRLSWSGTPSCRCVSSDTAPEPPQRRSPDSSRSHRSSARESSRTSTERSYSQARRRRYVLSQRWSRDDHEGSSMHHNFIPSSDVDSSTPVGLPHNRSAAVRARALEIVGILYRCDADESADQLLRHSQANNLKLAALAESLVAVVDGSSDGSAADAQTTLAAHFWLREIRRLGHVHRRTDRSARHIATTARCVGGARSAAGKAVAQQSDRKRVDFAARV